MSQNLHAPEHRSSLTDEYFAFPPRTDRPGIRWWWQAPMSVTELIEELEAIGAVGFGEVEIAFSPGFWADAAQREALAGVLERAQQLDIGVAMTLGAAWPLQTPNTARGSDYAAQEIQYGASWVDADGTEVDTPIALAFDDSEGTRGAEVHAVIAARVLQRGDEATIVPTGLPWGDPTRIEAPASSTILDKDSMRVLTGEWIEQGRGESLRWTPDPGQWVLITLWVRDCAQGVTSFIDARAATAALDYLDEHQLGETALLLSAEDSTATELFEDSLELNADSLFWSPDLPQRFIDMFGYDLTVYLPLLIAHGQCRYWVPNEVPVADFAVEGKIAQRVRSDYERLLTKLYTSDHLRLIQQWATGHSMRHKAQAAYGQNLEPVMSFRELVACGGRAEVESLNSGDRIPIRMTHPNWRYALDWQRSCVAGAHQGGAVRISSELGAQMDACYGFSLADYRRMMDKEWAVGITKPFVHGFAAQPDNAPWPTQGRFGSIVSESWNHRGFPQWDHWSALTGYWARGTAVLETGIARCDVAIYRDGFLTTAARGNEEADITAPDQLIDARALEREGFTVQIIDPVGLAAAPLGVDSADCVVAFPEGPAYRVIILGENRVMPEALSALADAAQCGMRVILVGDGPIGDSGWGGRDRDCEVADLRERLLSCSTVRRVEEWDDIPQALRSLGVRPRASWHGPTLLSQVRDSDEGRIVLVYNPDSYPVATVINVEGGGSVEALDLDTGDIHRLDNRERDGEGMIRVHVALDPLGLVVFRVVPSTLERAGSSHTVSACRLAGGTVGQGTPASRGRDLTLEEWSLSVESAQPGGPRTVTLTGQGPGDWRSIQGLESVSGVGIYRARVADECRDAAARGAVLHLGELGGSAVVRVAGKCVGPLLLDGADVDLGYCLADDPWIEIEVRTTLRNAALAADLYTSGPWTVEHPPAPHGLLGPVVLSARVED